MNFEFKSNSLHRAAVMEETDYKKLFEQEEYASVKFHFIFLS